MKGLAKAVEDLRQHNLAFEEREEFAWQAKLEKLRLRTEAQKTHNDARAKRVRRPGGAP